MFNVYLPILACSPGGARRNGLRIVASVNASVPVPCHVLLVRTIYVSDQTLNPRVQNDIDVTLPDWYTKILQQNDPFELSMSSA